MKLFIGSLAFISFVNALEKCSGGQRVLFVSEHNGGSPSNGGNGGCIGPVF